MLRRLGIFLSAFGVAVVGGMLLILVFDFVSQIDTPINGFADFMWSLHGLQYALVVILTYLILIVPVDNYFIIWGSGAARDVSIFVTLELFLFFALIGLVIGAASRERGIGDAIINSYLFIFALNLILIILIMILSTTFLGMALTALIQGATGRDFWLFVVLSVLENGTILAVFSSLVTSVLEDQEAGNLDTPICTDPVSCPL